MSSEPPVAGKEDPALSSAEPGKLLQNPQPPRNQEQVIPSTKPAEQEGRTPYAVAESPPPLLLNDAGHVKNEVKDATDGRSHREDQQ